MNYLKSMAKRPRRNRRTEAIRSMVRENHLTADDFLAPLFCTEKKEELTPIKSMPGQFRLGEKNLIAEVSELYSLGIKGICLFPAVTDNKKDSTASYSLDENCFYYRYLSLIKERFPEMLIMTDVALDPYSSDGHDGLVDHKTGHILNDQTIEILVEMSVLQARAGADLIGPSDMMDGRVRAIRQGLDDSGHNHVGIMSYTAKYASAFYGPFRDALESAPKSGDKKTYQMDPANRKEALIEAKLDEEEGADILMVKPALSYLDIISDLSQETNLPVAAYNVSGEYAMVKAAASLGWIDEKKVMLETLLSMKRAGASIILTYFAKDAARALQ